MVIQYILKFFHNLTPCCVNNDLHVISVPHCYYIQMQWIWFSTVVICTCMHSFSDKASPKLSYYIQNLPCTPTLFTQTCPVHPLKEVCNYLRWSLKCSHCVLFLAKWQTTRLHLLEVDKPWRLPQVLQWHPLAPLQQLGDVSASLSHPQFQLLLWFPLLMMMTPV